MALTTNANEASSLAALQAVQAARKAEIEAHAARLLAEGETPSYTEVVPVQLTQAEYDALTVKDDDVLYVIVD